MSYQFDPEKFGYLPPKKMPKVLRSIEHRRAFVKVICVSDNAFWYSSCYRISLESFAGDYRWVFFGGLWSIPGGPWAISRPKEYENNHVYCGCITSEIYAKKLLIHLLGTVANNSTLKYGKQRLLAPSEPIDELIKLYDNHYETPISIHN